MAKKKIISINKIQELADNISVSDSKIKWNDIDIDIKNALMPNEAIGFAKSASEICFSENGDYIPEMLKFAIGYATITSYTNLELPEFLNDKYKIVMYTDLVSKITEVIDKDQYESLMYAVDERIEYKLNANIDYMNRQIDTLYIKAEELFANFSNMFSGIDIEEFKNIMTELSQNKLDESKLMEAYMKYKK